ncbi:hypothetical protein BH11PSE3_BH11PSE3_48580 [soil metagenome]
MSKSVSAKHIALRICKVLQELNGADLHWISIAEVCERLDEEHSKAIDVALAYASEHELLACGPSPVQSVMLTPKGLTASRGKFKKSHRDSG